MPKPVSNPGAVGHLTPLNPAANPSATHTQSVGNILSVGATVAVGVEGVFQL